MADLVERTIERTVALGLGLLLASRAGVAISEEISYKYHLKESYCKNNPRECTSVERSEAGSNHKFWYHMSERLDITNYF